jgi:hypothetical protein
MHIIGKSDSICFYRFLQWACVFDIEMGLCGSEIELLCSVAREL